jgi:hypothetical protein
MKDPREPTTYFKQQSPSPESIERLRDKLDDLLAALVAYKEKADAPTAATKKIVDQERIRGTGRHQGSSRKMLLMKWCMEVLMMQLNV